MRDQEIRSFTEKLVLQNEQHRKKIREQQNTIEKLSKIIDNRDLLIQEHERVSRQKDELLEVRERTESKRRYHDLLNQFRKMDLDRKRHLDNIHAKIDEVEQFIKSERTKLEKDMTKEFNVKLDDKHGYATNSLVLTTEQGDYRMHVNIDNTLTINAMAKDNPGAELIVKPESGNQLRLKIQ